jgi:hypothetical protein
MSVLVAVFNQTTSWSGRTVTYEEGPDQFILQDHGPITAQKVLGYDAQDQLNWVFEGLRGWVYDFATWERTHRREVQGAGQSSSESPDSSGEPLTVRRARSSIVVPKVEGPERDVGSSTSPESVRSGARFPRRRSYKKLEIVGALVALVVVIALVAIARHGGGSGLGSGSGSGGDTASPTPIARKITDPSVTLSPAITKFVTVIARADHSAYHAWQAVPNRLDEYTKQHGAAHEDIRVARDIQPKNDGSKQWRLADRYASCTGQVVKYESLVVKDTLAQHAAAENKDFVALRTWARRMTSGHDAYFAYIFSGINWSGYGVVGQRFTSVTATWTQPQLYPKGAAERRVDIWVGLDGWDARRCEQTGIGIDQFGTDSRADYWSWYEMLPRPPVTEDMLVKAGDTVTATVTSLGGHRFKLTLADSTQGQSFSTIETTRAAKSDSAEIIVEAHLGHGMGLADFDPVRFTNCAVDGRPITSFHWKKINITAIGNLAMTSTSVLRADGTSITVTRR